MSVDTADHTRDANLISIWFLRNYHMHTQTTNAALNEIMCDLSRDEPVMNKLSQDAITFGTISLELKQFLDKLNYMFL